MLLQKAKEQRACSRVGLWVNAVMVQMQKRCPDQDGATEQKGVIDETLDLCAQVAVEMDLFFEDQGYEKSGQILRGYS